MSYPPPPRHQPSASTPTEPEVGPEFWRETQASLGQRFEAVAARTPTAPAVSDGSRRWDYATLERISRGLGQRIHRSGAGAHEVIGIFLPNGATHVAAVLAVLRAGRIYVSLDPAYPPARLLTMTRLAGVDRLVTAPDLAAPASAFGLPMVVAVPDDPPADDGPLTDVPAETESFAALYFTSGSTGEPKAVAHTHRNVLFDIGRQTRDMQVVPADRFDLLFSPSFSAFLSPVFGALLTGASVHAFDFRQQAIGALRDWLEREAVTVSTASVSTFRKLAAVLPPGRSFPALRLLSLGAEPLRASDLEHFRRSFSATCTLQNALATTETRTIAQCYLRADAPPPEEVCVGHPVAGKALELRDGQDRPVADGEIGEIVITSAFISPGAWDELRRLPQRKLPAPRVTVHRTGDLARRRADGGIVHLGRKDAQLKVRGHRIEAGEVESHLLSHAAVREAAVFVETASGSGAERERLVALWVRKDSAPAGTVDLRAHLRARLPDYMVPNLAVEVPALPLTETGKLARSLLPETLRHGSAPAPRRPAPPTGGDAAALDEMRALWCRVLAAETVGDDDDFFALGGDSLAAAELMAAIASLRGWAPPAAWLIDAPTLPAFFERVAAASAPTGAHRLRRRLLQPAAPGGGRPLYLLPAWNNSALSFRDLARPEGGSREVWVIDGFDDADRPAAANVAEIAGRVREALQTWHPELEVDVGGHSMGGVIAWELMRQIAETGAAPGRVFLIDSSRFYASRGAREQAWVERTATWSGRVKTLGAALRAPGEIAVWPILRRIPVAKLEWWLWKRWRSAPTGRAAARYTEIIELSRHYVVRDQPGPVTLLRACHQSDWPNLFSADLGWGPHCRGGLEIVAVPGNHATVVKKPHAAALAKLLGQVRDGGPSHP